MQPALAGKQESAHGPALANHVGRRRSDSNHQKTAGLALVDEDVVGHDRQR
jgi:hypothetical protein